MRVYIADWSNARTAYTRDGKLFLQVAAGCIDCSICKSRIDFVSGALHRGRIEHSVVANTDRTMVHVGLPKPPRGKTVELYLQEILGVTVTRRK